MRKEESLILTRHIDGKMWSGKQCTTNQVMVFWAWKAKKSFGEMAKCQKLLRATKTGNCRETWSTMSWRYMAYKKKKTFFIVLYVIAFEKKKNFFKHLESALFYIRSSITSFALNTSKRFLEVCLQIGKQVQSQFDKKDRKWLGMVILWLDKIMVARTANLKEDQHINRKNDRLMNIWLSLSKN